MTELAKPRVPESPEEGLLRESGVSTSDFGRDRELEQDRVLVDRCQQGDDRAFEELFLRHRDRLHRLCLQRLGDQSAAEDVVQEAFVRAWRAMPAFAGERRFYPWLSVIASNLCTDMQRKKRRENLVVEQQLDLVAPPVAAEQEAVLESHAEIETSSCVHLAGCRPVTARCWSFARAATGAINK